MSAHYIITIDGPAGTGKSTAAPALARRLGFRFFGSGSFYRAIAWMSLDAGITLDDSEAIVKHLRLAHVTMEEVDGRDRVYVDGRDVTDALFDNRISQVVYKVADPPIIRREASRLAREMTSGTSFVTEGRDQGTVVFPDADIKFYLDAGLEARAERRWRELQVKGDNTSLDEVRRQISERDERDRGREIGALTQPKDAIYVDNSDMTLEETIERLYDLASERLKDS